MTPTDANSPIRRDAPSTGAHLSARRRAGALLINLVVPGAGLICSRRDWLGLLLMLLFLVCAQIALAGWLLAPAAIPSALTIGAAAAAGLVWAVSQVVLLRRLRWLMSSDTHAQFALLLGDARRARSAGDHETARLALQGALNINDEDIEANREYARLLSSTDSAAARRASRRLAALDPRDPAAQAARAPITEDGA